MTNFIFMLKFLQTRFQNPFDENVAAELNGSHIGLYLDMTNRQISITIQTRMAMAYQHFLSEFLNSILPKVEPKEAAFAELFSTFNHDLVQSSIKVSRKMSPWHIASLFGL